MKQLQGRTAVITGAGSGIGLELARLAAREGMKLVLADVQQDALVRAVEAVRALGATAIGVRCDVSKATEVETLGAVTATQFGAPHLVLNNAGVSLGGLIWEHSAKDWEWLLGINLMGVAHGVRVFTPMMLAAAKADAAYEGHIVNTASMAGLVAPPNMGLYNASKHAVVALSETLYQDLRLVTSRVSASVLCPFWIPTGITQSERNRHGHERGSETLTRSQQLAQASFGKAVGASKVSAEQVAQKVFDAVREQRFYIYSHPQALASVQVRMEDVLQARNPSDPFAAKPELGEQLRSALHDGD